MDKPPIRKERIGSRNKDVILLFSNTEREQIKATAAREKMSVSALGRALFMMLFRQRIVLTDDIKREAKRRDRLKPGRRSAQRDIPPPPPPEPQI